jgi:hypothetical protein
MKELKRIFTVVLMAAILSFTAFNQMTAFGQKGNDNNRPPKEQPRVKEKEKPPPSNTNNSQNNNNRRKP